MHAVCLHRNLNADETQSLAKHVNIVTIMWQTSQYHKSNMRPRNLGRHSIPAVIHTSHMSNMFMQAHALLSRNISLRATSIVLFQCTCGHLYSFIIQNIGASFAHTHIRACAHRHAHLVKRLLWLLILAFGLFA